MYVTYLWQVNGEMSENVFFSNSVNVNASTVQMVPQNIQWYLPLGKMVSILDSVISVIMSDVLIIITMSDNTTDATFTTSLHAVYFQ